MIKRIESWLRRIFGEEAGKVETSLRVEIEKIQTSFADEREKYLEEIRSTIAADLAQFRADCVAENLLRAVPQTWKADEHTRKQDEALRKAK